MSTCERVRSLRSREHKKSEALTCLLLILQSRQRCAREDFFVGGGRSFGARRLPKKRIVFGNLQGAMRRGRGGKEKDILSFGIAWEWKATALEADVWVETVTEGGRRFMAAWRKEETGAATHRQEKRETTRLGKKLLSHTEVWNLVKRHPLV